MEYTTLGRTDIKISRICLGTMTWGLQNTQAEAFEQMDYALERGVQFWDTAEMYAVPPTPETYGTTETIIGNWFKDSYRRDEVVLATKFSPMPWARGPELADPTRESITMAVENSLKRLQTDYIDLYQLHWPTTRSGLGGAAWWTYMPPQDKDARSRIVENIHEVLETLDGFVQAGKIRTIGLSNDTAWGISQYIRQSELHGLARIVSLQNEYSLLRRYIERNIAETCALEDVSILAWSPLAMGLISGKYLRGARPDGARFSAEVMREQMSRFETRFSPQADIVIVRLLEIAKRYGLDLCQVAIKFTIRYPYLSSSIIGATTMEQLKTNIDAIDTVLSDEMMTEIAALYREYPVPF